MGVFREAIYGVSFDNGRKEGSIERREEIVRCRDCKQFANNIHGCYCKKSITTLSDPNGFCAWGERRDA